MLRKRSRHLSEKAIALKSVIYRSMFVVGALTALCWIVGMVAWAVAFQIIWKRHAAGALAFLVVAAVYMFYKKMLSKHSSVEFRYAHEEAENGFWARPWVTAITAAAIGAVVGSVATVLIQRLVKVYWP